eukprot:PITA_28876
MSTLLDTFKLVDVPMNKKMPTWNNRRAGEAALGRMLDCFLIHEDLLCTLPLYMECVGIGGISDHLRIYLQISGPSKKPRAPFKFFTGFQKDPEFINLITQLTDELGLGYLTDDTKLQLMNLESQKAKILLEKEEQWRLKSRAIWLQVGDGNTKFFHNFANGRKASNTIW